MATEWGVNVLLIAELTAQEDFLIVVKGHSIDLLIALD